MCSIAAILECPTHLCNMVFVAGVTFPTDGLQSLLMNLSCVGHLCSSRAILKVCGTSLSIAEIFPIQSLFCFRSIKMHIFPGIVVVFPLSSSLDYERRLPSGFRMKNTALISTFIIPGSSTTLPLSLDVPMLPSAASASTLSTSPIVWKNHLPATTCYDVPLSSII